MMSKVQNPFEYGEATNFSPEEILEYYIQDFNYSRFIQSTRNIFLIGERGSGKTMTLLYNKVALNRNAIEGKNENRLIGCYIPCKTLLTHKREYELHQSNEFVSAQLSEQFMVLPIAYSIVKTIQEVGIQIDKELDSELLTDFSYISGKQLPPGKKFLEAISLYLDKESVQTQELMNTSDDSNEVLQNTVSFNSLVLPLLNLLTRIPELSSAHFLLMLDDIHDLNKYQIRSMNSWIGYRDHRLFSFKISSSKLNRPEYVTASGGTILEGHDFLTIDMEEPFQNKFSDFGLLAKKIIENRLKNSGIEIEADQFFPINPKMKADLEASNQAVLEEAESKFAGIKNNKKKIADYVYKYGRAHYFRSRSAQANLPPYSGFETIVHLSTGVIRNLLYPCYWMYDKAISTHKEGVMTSIAPRIQTDIIKEKSEELWKKIESDLFNSIADCSTHQAEQIKNLFENLAILFRERLQSDISEPRAITFTISAYTSEYREKLEPLLKIAQSAQILYTRVGSAKDDGKRETYYVPNRMLIPIKGLDPVGQHARVSLKAEDIWEAAKGKKFKMFIKGSDKSSQSKLFEG